MESVLESKQKEDLDTFKNSMPTYFYALYQLKANRINREGHEGDKNENSTVTQFLDNEATLNKDFSLTLLNHDISDHNESYLRESLAKKIEKGTLYASSIGNISSFNLGFKRNEENMESICYYYLYRQNQNPNNEYLVCFVVQNSEYNLDLFRIELDLYFQENIEPFLENNELNKSKDKILKGWYDSSINYITRLVSLLGKDISVIIEEAFSCGQLNLDSSLGEKIKTDIRTLFNSLNSCYLISNFMHQPSSNSPKTKLVEQSIKPRLSLSVDSKCKEQLSISFDATSNQLKLSKNEKCEFTNELTDKLIQKATETKDSFELKQILENYKLKLAQELNSFNRLLRKGESNYYDIYRSYVYLKNSPMNTVLVNMYTNNCDAFSHLFEPLKIVLGYFNSCKTSRIQN